MIRLTTPEHIFTFPQAPSQYDEILITYCQCGQIVLEKHETDCTFDDVKKTATVRLTQENTKAFSAESVAVVQVRAKKGDMAYASQRFEITVYDVLNKEVL